RAHKHFSQALATPARGDLRATLSNAFASDSNGRAAAQRYLLAAVDSGCIAFSNNAILNAGADGAAYESIGRFGDLVVDSLFKVCICFAVNGKCTGLHPASCLDAASLREPVSASLENATLAPPRQPRDKPGLAEPFHHLVQMRAVPGFDYDFEQGALGG